MAKKIIHISAHNVGKLKCDTPTCGFICAAPLPWSHDLVGLPCPLCGASLLTEHDYMVTERTLAWIAWLNKWFGWLGSEKPPAPGKGVTVSIRYHDGTWTIKKGVTHGTVLR